MISKDKQKLRRQLYNEGCSDGEIARAIGATKSCVSGWRRRNGLPANCNIIISVEEDQKRRVLLQRGLTDAEVANQCGVTPAAINLWRQRHGIRTNGVARKGWTI